MFMLRITTFSSAHGMLASAGNARKRFCAAQGGKQLTPRLMLASHSHHPQGLLVQLPLCSPLFFCSSGQQVLPQPGNTAGELAGERPGQLRASSSLPWHRTRSGCASQSARRSQ